MGLHATLHASVTCPTCDSPVSAGWQFHFGDVSQVPGYRIGDTITWGGYDLRGDPSMRDVIAVAYCDLEHFCADCGIKYALADIHIVDNVVQFIAFRSTEPWIAEEVFVGPERKPY